MSVADTATAILSAATAEPAAPSVETTLEPEENATGVLPSAETAATTDQTQTEPAPEAASAGKAPTDAEIFKAIKQFRDSDPNNIRIGKQLNDIYGRYKGYESLFPTVQEARAVQSQLETVGGLEGIAEMQSTLSAIEETDALLDAGDPKVLDQIVEDSPDGFKRLAPHYLSRLQKLDPDAYTRTIQPHLVRSLNDAGLPRVLAYLSERIGENKEAQKVVQDIQGWLDEQKSLAERANQDVLNPEREKLDKGWKELQAERKKDLETGIANAMQPHINQELGSRLRQYSEWLNSQPPAVKNAVARDCVAKLAQALAADKAYQTQVNAMMGARRPDREKVIALNKSKVSALADSVIQAVASEYKMTPGRSRLAAKPAPNANGNKPAIPTKIIKLGAPPKETDIDWNHPNMTTEAYIRHRAMLKDGRAVEWA